MHQRQSGGRPDDASSSAQVPSGGADHGDGSGFSETEARAWNRSRLLSHLSTLLLFQQDATAPLLLPSLAPAVAPDEDASSVDVEAPVVAESPLPSQPEAGGGAGGVVEVQIRMSELEALLDALSAAPRDAQRQAERIARQEREQLEADVDKAASVSSSDARPPGSPAAAAAEVARAALASLLPLEHPLTPLLSLLTWLDAREISFRNMQQLIRTVSTGAWTALCKL
jgi:hypothetical protein